jgi:hypothetical protein
MFYQRKYTPHPKAHGYPESVRRQAIKMYVDGMNLGRIGRHLDLHHRTVSLWVQANASSLPDLPVPQEVQAAEMDELSTFIGDKKTHLHPDCGRPAHLLFPGLASRLGSQPASYSGSRRCSPQSWLV